MSYFQIAHLQSINCNVGDILEPNSILGVMGGSGYGSNTKYVRHIHQSQLKEPKFDLIYNTINQAPNETENLKGKQKDFNSDYTGIKTKDCKLTYPYNIANDGLHSKLADGIYHHGIDWVNLDNDKNIYATKRIKILAIKNDNSNWNGRAIIYEILEGDNDMIKGKVKEKLYCEALRKILVSKEDNQGGYIGIGEKFIMTIYENGRVWVDYNGSGSYYDAEATGNNDWPNGYYKQLENLKDKYPVG